MGAAAPQTQKRARVAGSSVTIRFDCLAAPSDVRMHERTHEPVTSGHLSESHAARYIDVLIGKCRLPLTNAPNILACSLKNLEEVSGKAVYPSEFKRLARQQVLDLISRCEQRMEQLGDKRQFAVKHRNMQLAAKRYYELEFFEKPTRNLWLNLFKSVDEAELINDLATRVPDVLVQRFMPRRVHCGITGLDVDTRLHSVLLSILQLLPFRDAQKRCAYPLI